MVTMAAELCLSNGDYEEALGHLRDHLSKNESQDVNHKLHNIVCLMNIAGCLIGLCQYDEGYCTLQTVITNINNLPEDSYKYTIAAEANYNLGIVARKIGKPMSDYFIQAIELFVKAEKFENASDVYSELAEHSDCKDKQISFLQCAQEMYNTAGNKIKESLAIIRLASLYSITGQEECCHQMITTARILIVTVTDSTLQGQLLLQLGVVYKSQKMYRESFESFERALPLVKSERIEGALLQNMGALCNELKQFNEAIVYHKAAITKNRKSKLYEDEVKCLCNLGYAEAQNNDYSNSANSFITSLAKAEEIRNDLLIVQSLEGLGSVYYHMKQFNKSQNYFEKALKVMIECNGDDIGLAKERIMEKLSEVIEIQSAVKTPSVSESYIEEMTNYLSNCKSEDDTSSTNSVLSKDTILVVHEGCLALGQNTKDQFTTIGVNSNTIIPITEQIAPSINNNNNNVTKTCTIL